MIKNNSKEISKIVKFIESIGSTVMKLQFDAEKMPIKDRDNHIIKKLSEMENCGTF